MGDILKKEGGLVIDRPGNVLFIPSNSSGALDYANAKRNTAKINTITITNSKTKTEIPDGNSFYPAGDRVTSIAGTVAIEFSTIDPVIWAMCSGTTFVSKASDKMMKFYEYTSIESGTIQLEEEYAENGFVKVVGSDGVDYEKTSSTPSAGEFKITTSDGATTLTFASADEGKAVAISMEIVTATMSYTQGRNPMANHKIIIDTEYSTLDNSEKVPVNFIISQASVSGDMVDALQKDPSATKTLTFNMYAPRAGEQPYEVKMCDKSTGKKLVAIDVTTSPTTTTYDVGDTFDPTGMVVTATYNDGTTAAVTGYSYEPSGALKATDSVISIEYKGKSASQIITVS